MIEIPGYDIQQRIYQSPRSEAFRGVRLTDNRRVVLKALKNKYPTPEEVSALKREYEILKTVEGPHTIGVLALEFYKKIPVLVLEDFEGKPLYDYLDGHTFHLEDLLKIAVDITGGLGEIHGKGVIHKDINPANLILNPDTNQLKIIDFGLSTTFSRENPAVENPNRLVGTLAYISPEQTGRMNRALDYRTDFYSLGVTFYRMFTGRLPFLTDSPLELVHCHIAKVPPAPVEVDEKIPRPLSAIIMKLLAKAAEDRYQGIHGLKTDLEECLNRLENKDGKDFDIGKNDFTDRLRISEKLYGREKEILTLIRLFGDITEGKKEMIFVSGMPGIGKSALINEIHKPIVEKYGYFGSGKYDQYDKNIPYSAIFQAFGRLLKQFLSESEEKIDQLKKDILAAVGENGRVIIDMIPEVEFITGKQPDVQELPPIESQNRFNVVFQDFVSAFACPTRPLIIFIDDLQWADVAGLDLLQSLMANNDLTYFLLIGAYRDQEIDEGHPFTGMQTGMKKDGLSWTTITLTPLDENHIASLLSETLHSSVEKTKEMAALILQKTGGNPFFVKEYLRTLYAREFIRFNRADRVEDSCWTWDIPQIKAGGITENIIQLLAEKVSNLPQDTWKVLKIMCCIGKNSTLEQLAPIYEKQVEDTFKDLTVAIEEGIVLLVDDRLKFAHDRVWEAAYSLIDEEERKQLHYRVGKAFIDITPGYLSGDSVFVIANQWNYSKELLDIEEKRQLVEINFNAGHKAKISAAYASAVDFFRHGAQLLDDQSWETLYRFTLSYYTEWVEAEYMARNFEKAGELADIVGIKAENILDKIDVYSTRISYYNSQSQFTKALEMSSEALKQLGLSLPKKGTKPLIMKKFIRSKMLLGKRKASDLLDLPEMTDQRIKSMMAIMLECMATAVLSRPDLAPILTLEMVNLSLKHGNTPVSAFGYAMYGIILCAFVGDIERGYQFGEFAIELAERNDIKAIKPGVYFLFSAVIMHMKKHFRDTLVYLKKNHQYCMEAGQFEYLGYSDANYNINLFFSGENLNAVKEEWQIYAGYIKRAAQYHTVLGLSIWEQAIDLLANPAEDQTLFDGVFDEKTQVPAFMEQNDIQDLAIFYSAKMMVCTFFQMNQEVIGFAERSEAYLPAVMGLPTTQIFYFYYAMALSAQYPQVPADFQKKYLKKLLQIQKMYKKWGDHNPYNYRHKYLLISAEIGAISGKDPLETQRLYTRAIHEAYENRFLSDEALANERASHYYLSIEQEKISGLYLNEAHLCYMKWGAGGKTADMENKYGNRLTKKKKGSGIGDMSYASTDSITDGLDLKTILKASNTIAGEILLDKMLEKIMHFVIENAGAEKGFFLLFKHGEWVIEAEGSMTGADKKILHSIPLRSAREGDSPLAISQGIVNYVERTNETVVLNDAAVEGNFTADVYIKSQKPKSVLCVPLVNQGKLTAILYMENNLTKGAFTQDRVDVLNTLSSQIAISTENARIYRDLDELNKNLEQKVTERTRELQEKNRQIVSSIRYSQKIQETIMPLEETIKTVFPGHFIVFKPKSIVSGDFYWFKKTEDYVFAAVVDCTGHGVPGALLSMMGAIFLNDITEVSKITEPEQILEELHQKVRSHLKQDEDHSQMKDGMDVCLCRIEKEKNKLYFAGAKRPLFIVSPKGNKQDIPGELLRVIRGDRKSIGGSKRETTRTYTCHEVDIQDGDMIYLTTDGFVDQPNPEVPKYGSKRFRKFLKMLAGFPPEEQKKLLLEELEGFQQNEEQRDDITIIGMRV